MRRRVVIVPILLLVGALVARRRRRVRAATAPLAAPPRPPVALPEPGVRFVSVPWTPVETDPADPRLTIRYRADERMRLDRVDAQETPTQVFVTVLMRWRPPAGGPVAFAQDHEAVVELSSPVGTRELVHTPVDVEPAGATTDDEPSAPPLYP